MEFPISECCGDSCCSCCSSEEFDTNYFVDGSKLPKEFSLTQVKGLYVADAMALDTSPLTLRCAADTLDVINVGSGFGMPTSLTGGGGHEPYILPTMSKFIKGGAKAGFGVRMTGEALNFVLGTEPATIEGGMWISDS